jgi:hypothetical protein
MNLHEFWKFKQFPRIKSDNQIHKMETIAQRCAGIWPMIVVLADRRPAWLGPAMAQIARTGLC